MGKTHDLRARAERLRQVRAREKLGPQERRDLDIAIHELEVAADKLDSVPALERREFVKRTIERIAWIVLLSDCDG